MSEALMTWRKKLEYFQQQEAVASDAAQKFSLAEQISEAKAKIAELEMTAGSRQFITPSAFHSDISRIIKYAPAELIGRGTETKLLSDAWDQAVRNEAKRPRVLTFVALGGEGKTSLVAKWAADLAHQGWPGCDAVFAWSFYHQGTDEKTADSSDLFLKEALTVFGDAAMAESAQGAYDKGRRLAQLVGERRALLILDGVEPLQYAPASPTPGELKDAGLAALLKGLAATNHGLCIVTTRYSIPDLRAFWQTTAPMHELKRLSKEAGVRLLQNLGVRKENGTLEEFETLVEDVKGHALTLNLLGGFLKRAFKGDIRQRDRVKFEKADDKIEGGHVFRTMAAYEQWILTGGDEGRREVAVLRLMGLFDRPADAGCLKALRSESIPDLTEPLFSPEEEDWEFSVTGLEEAKLLTVNRDAAGTMLSLDAHPLLREYFARQLRTQHPKAWRDAHRRLYEHLCATADKPQPTLEDLQPLYQAVAHGCQAGMQQETLHNVYRARILRDVGGPDAFYSRRKLGAHGEELAAVGSFFDKRWTQPAAELGQKDQAELLNDAAVCLRALGRLSDAREAMRAAVDMAEKSAGAALHAGTRADLWKEVAIYSSNRSELELTLGDVSSAVRAGERAVFVADLSGDAIWRMFARATHADALHQTGQAQTAHSQFEAAEVLQQETKPDSPLIHSLRGFRYCDHLLGDSERKAWLATLAYGGKQTATLPSEAGPDTHDASHSAPSEGGGVAAALQCLAAVIQRATKTLECDKRLGSLLPIALNHLTLGRAALYRAILEKSEVRATSEVALAVDGLRHAGRIDYLPLGLLSRAWLRSLTSARTGPESAQSDLDEAWEIAKRGPMPLFLADIHLYRARLFHAVIPYPWPTDSAGNPRGPKDDLAAARALVEIHGYWRRMEELEDAEAVVRNRLISDSDAVESSKTNSKQEPQEIVRRETSSVRTSSTSERKNMATSNDPSPPIFISYAHKDNENTDPAKCWLDRLR